MKGCPPCPLIEHCGAGKNDLAQGTAQCNTRAIAGNTRVTLWGLQCHCTLSLSLSSQGNGKCEGTERSPHRKKKMKDAQFPICG